MASITGLGQPLAGLAVVSSLGALVDDTTPMGALFGSPSAWMTSTHELHYQSFMLEHGFSEILLPHEYKSPNRTPKSLPMMMTTSPIDIATPTRNPSSSPPTQGKHPANYHGHEDSKTSAMMSPTAFGADGAKPISVNNPNGRTRRESLAGSLVGGMSWGGVSVGSWIRDDIIMTGTSPFPYQSPSYHSSSYLPKLEANFMRDFSCCGIILPTLHDLVSHYEEKHHQPTPQSLRTISAAQQARESQQPSNKAVIAAQAANSVQQQAQKQQKDQEQQLQRSQVSAVGMSQAVHGPSSIAGGIQRMRQQQQQAQTPPPNKKTPIPVDEMDEVEDMEIDDPIGNDSTAAETPMSNIPRTPQQSQPLMFGQQQRPQLNLNSSGSLLHQGLRNSQPTTPAASGFGYQHNPTVSSVNTPTLTTNPMQHSQAYTPDTSIPGTPDELDEDFTNMAQNMNLGSKNVKMGGMMGMGNGGNMNFQFGYGNDLGDLYIDEPAKRLFSPNGAYGNQRDVQQFAQLGLGNGQFSGNEDLVQRLRQQQMVQMPGISNAQVAMLLAAEENKPFRCPVIGCEKAYKNMNGLKYHKTHGHQNQTLHENVDGTFSILNPETSAPYPGITGMEKEKPYKCDVCPKRYKNLNGLKYHKSHSIPCDPERNGTLQGLGLGGGLGLNVAGLPNIGEEMT